MQKKGSAVLEEILEDNQYYIDRTQLLEQEILGFPAVYIEGAAASGKTTAVRILLKHHPEVEQQIFSMKADESVRKFADRSAELLEKMQNGSLVWVVLDDVPGKLPRETEEKIVDFVRNLPGGCRLLMMGREDPPEGLLELFWKRKMAIWGQKQLCLNKAEIKSLAERMHAPLQAEEVIRVTGGWAGCVEVILRMAANQKQGREKITAEELRRSYEVHTYIHMQILDKLSMEEQLMMRNTRFCSWMNEELSSSFFGIPHGKQVLVRLERKGLFTYVKEKHHWKLSPLFAEEYSENLMPADTEIRKNLGEWYEEHGLIKEMLECLSQSGDKHVYWEALKRHYEKIPFLDIEYGEMLQAEDESPQACYLRGMYYFSHKKPEEGSREMFLLEKYAQENPSVYGEIYLNLGYADTELSLDQWLHLLEKYAAEKPVHLYEIMGNSFTYLCGRRDLSGLFACSKQEENRKAKLWRSCLCEREWMAYRLARFDYYLETERRAAIPEEDLFLTEQIVNGSYDWKIRLAVMNLLCKLQKIQYEEEREERICLLERGLLQEEYFSCVRSAEAIGCFYGLWRKKPEKFSEWMRNKEIENRKMEIGKICIAELYYRVKGCIFLNQYEQAKRILEKSFPYMQMMKLNRFLIEAQFAEALIFWEEELCGQALQKMISAFLMNCDTRYVVFYTEYGVNGLAVLEYYAEWLQKNAVKKWSRKKKYNYGSVLRMPMEDYTEVLIRGAKRELKNGGEILRKDCKEKFTTMEMVIWQGISRGLTNAEISRELNLKLPTVKGHLYSLYKKLEVGSRAQAIIKGKEFGLIK